MHSAFKKYTTEPAGKAGLLGNQIPHLRGVWILPSLLTPLFLNLSLNDSMRLLGKPDARARHPANENRKISLFLSAVGMVLLSWPRTDCNRQLILLFNYFQKAGLKINYPKTQIISIGRQPLASNWFLSNNVIQQVKSFSYLGVQFATNSSWRVHQEAILPKLDVLRVFY